MRASMNSAGHQPLLQVVEVTALLRLLALCIAWLTLLSLKGGRVEKAPNQPSSTSSTSASSSTSNSAESSASSVSDVRPSIYRSLGIPAANEWNPPTGGQAPDWAQSISVDALLKNVCSVKELYDVFQQVLQPLDAKYGSTASGISQGCSWRSHKNQPKATLAMWAHGALFEEFAKPECDIDALQRRIDM